MAIVFQTLQDLPEMLQEYLQDDSFSAINLSIIDKYGLSQDGRDTAMVRTIADVFLGRLTLERFPHALSAALQMEKEKVMSLASEIAVRIFQPAREYLGPAETYAARWDEKTAGAGYDLIGEPLTLPSYTREELIRMLMDLRPKNVVHPKATANYEKLVGEIVYRGRSNFDEAHYRTGLTQSMEQDGVQMKPEDADALLLQIKQVMAASTIAKSPSTVDPKESAKQSAKEQKAIEKDVAAAARTMKEKLGTAAPAESTDDLGAAIMKKVQVLDAIYANETMQKIIDARVHDVRDTRATMDALTKPVVSGGAGLDADHAMQVLMIIEEEIHTTLKMKKQEVAPATPPAAPVAPQKETPAPAPKLVDDVYVKVLGNARMKELGASHQDNMRTSVSSSAASPKPVAAPATPPPTTPPSAPVARMNVEIPKPKMLDVRKSASVMGPVQEIENLRLVDFRRSAQTAEVRMEKIVSTINRMGEESYGDKIAAVFAWRRSEPYQMYEQLLTEALMNRKPLVVVIQEHVRDRKPTLDREEVLAIVSGDRTLEEW